jgi:hypothetical protein
MLDRSDYVCALDPDPDRVFAAEAWQVLQRQNWCVHSPVFDHVTGEVLIDA